MEPIQVRMFGEFSLTCGGVTVSDNSRSRKSWGILAYLIRNRERFIPQKKLMELYWNNSSTNPENALRTTMHRLRTLLDQLWPGAGRQLILRNESGYAWNNQVPLTLDCDRFEALLLSEPGGTEQRLEQLLEALDLYRGEFLPKQASDIWVIPICTHFQNRYLTAALEAAELLSARQRYPEAAAVCRRAIAADPYHEELCRTLIQILVAAGDTGGAAAVYDGLKRRLLQDFGLLPSEETLALYRSVVHGPGQRALDIEEVLLHLQESENSTGPLQCDYDYFKVLCRAESRSQERSGDLSHIALLSVAGSPDAPLTMRGTELAMQQLEQILCQDLRRGDVISRCSISQYILMLPNANYENSCMVCRRVIGAFNRAYPHSAARIHFLVRPLTPSVSVP